MDNQKIPQSLSKSRLLSGMQCTKRLWLELYRPSLGEDSASAEARFRVGHQVGDIAQTLYDPAGTGTRIDRSKASFKAAFAETKRLLTQSNPIFEAGFSAGGARIFADVLLPRQFQGKDGWRMIEVKSSASVKDYHRDDAAIQTYVARKAGVPLNAVSVACIDSSWVYPGGGDYRGLLKEVDLTDEAFAREAEVEGWIRESFEIARLDKEPEVHTGGHCSKPYQCPFTAYCESQEPQAEFPVRWLPRIQAKALKKAIEEGAEDLRQLPDELLNEQQLRVKTQTLANAAYFDAQGAAADLADCSLPAYFMDFETINLAVPIWQGTRPYQQIPFQFSVHLLTPSGKLRHREFLDLSGGDPSREFAEQLIDACGSSGPIFVYHAAFEKGRIKYLANRFPAMKDALNAITDRIVDLLPIATNRYYHPSQHGSWSIKKVLPAIAPELDYSNLDGVRDGSMAMDAFAEAVAPETGQRRRDEIRSQLLEYCARDTLAMIRMWECFTGAREISL